jgi:hypothetical protein
LPSFEIVSNFDIRISDWVPRVFGYGGLRGKHAAALLSDFLLSREGQQIFAQANRLVARKDIDWRSLGKLPERTHVLSVEKWAPRNKELISQFDKIFR